MPIDLQNLLSLRPVLALAALVLFLLWETGKPFYSYFKARGAARFKHGLHNVAFGLLNTLLIALGFAAAWSLAASFSAQHRIGILYWTTLPEWAHVVAAILLFDLWMYSWHRLNHNVGFFWRFHRVHHSDTCMDVTSATRFHFGEIALSSILRVPVILIIGMTLSELVVYEMLMLLVVQFHHANIRLPKALDRALRLLIVTPAMHKLHHSREIREQNSNYTAFLSIWDRLFLTYQSRADLENVKLGVDETSDRDGATFAGMMKSPLHSPDRRTIESPSPPRPPAM